MVRRIHWIRLWVENGGIGRAEQVQVFAARLFRREQNGRFGPVAEFEAMNLRWSNSRDPDNPEIFAQGLSRYFGKHCDLCSISDPANPTDHRGYPDQCVGTLQLEVVPGVAIETVCRLETTWLRSVWALPTPLP